MYKKNQEIKNVFNVIAVSILCDHVTKVKGKSGLNEIDFMSKQYGLTQKELMEIFFEFLDEVKGLTKSCFPEDNFKPYKLNRDQQVAFDSCHEMFHEGDFDVRTFVVSDIFDIVDTLSAEEAKEVLDNLKWELEDCKFTPCKTI